MNLMLTVFGMKFQHSFPEQFIVQMGINLCRCNAFMTEHELNGPYVGTVSEQMGGKGMSEGMRTYVFADARLLCKFFYDYENHHPTEFLSSAVQKNKVLKFLLDFRMHPDFILIKINNFDGIIRDRNQSLFVSLACHPDEIFFEKQIREFQFCKFRHPQTTPV